MSWIDRGRKELDKVVKSLGQPACHIKRSNVNRSLPSVVYALKGCLPRTNVRNLIKEGSKIKIDLSDLSAVRDDTKEEF